MVIGVDYEDSYFQVCQIEFLKLKHDKVTTFLFYYYWYSETKINLSSYERIRDTRKAM